jgi:hypothetical protein
VALALIASGCRGNGSAPLTELQRLKSGALELVLLSAHDAFRRGKDTSVIEFRSTSGGGLVDVGEVRGSATMPMPGAPMFGSVDVRRTSIAGRYTANSQFDMAGTWRMTIQWTGPNGQGAVNFAATVQ